MVVLNGDLTGHRDLIVEGRIAADTPVVANHVTITESGFVDGDIHGSTILVEGRVNGNLVGGERIVIRRSGVVHGNVSAPRVDVERGASFQGSVETTATSTDDL